MSRKIGWIAGAAALTLAAWGGCKKSEPPAPAQPTAPASRPAQATAESAPPAAPETTVATPEPAPVVPANAPDACEGGQQFDEVAIATQQAAIARVEADKATAAASEARRKADALLVAALHRHAGKCAERTLDASCVGAASGDPSQCRGENLQDSGAACKLMALLRQAVVGRNPALCGGIPDGGLRAMCEGGAGGELTCPPDGSEEAVVCRAMRDRKAPECGTSAAPCQTYWTLTALMKQDPVQCGRIPEPTARDHCRAIATGDASQCAARETIPGSCREVVIESNVEEVNAPEGARYVARLRATNVYAEAARCEARLDLRVGSDEKSIVKDLGTLAPGQEIREYTWGLEGVGRPPLMTVFTTCTWDPPQAKPAAP
ncbi:MAG: hypothetical protein AMXMBFR64_17160 [Myxococcales bacterium]